MSMDCLSMCALVCVWIVWACVHLFYFWKEACLRIFNMACWLMTMQIIQQVHLCFLVLVGYVRSFRERNMLLICIRTGRYMYNVMILYKTAKVLIAEHLNMVKANLICIYQFVSYIPDQLPALWLPLKLCHIIPVSVTLTLVQSHSVGRKSKLLTHVLSALATCKTL